MSELSIVIVIGGTSENQDLKNLLCHIKDGIASMAHFDSLNVNKYLSSIEGPEPLSDHGVKFSSPEVNIVVLPNATIEHVLNEVANAFRSLPKGVLLVYSGAICQSSASWILSDGVLKPDYIAGRISAASLKLQQTLADTTLEWMSSMSFHVACTSVPYGGDWRRVLSSRLPSSIAGHPLCPTVNRLHTPVKKPVPGSVASAKPELAPLPADISGVDAFCQRLQSVIELPKAPQPTCQPVSKANDCSIRIRRPCLYIFPEGSGQSSIFAVPGFSFMVNAGATRDPKCWKMAQHFENIDAILHTHWGVENCLGLTSLLPALMASNLEASTQPKTTLVLTAPPAHAITHPLTSEASASSDPLVMNVAAVANELAQAVRPFIADDKLTVQEVTRGGKLTAMPKPICLYYKVGCGSLDFYPLTPSEEDQAEVKKLAALWAKAAPNVVSALAEAPRGTSTIKHAALPLVSQLSVSGLLIWKSHRKGDRQVRILFVAPNAHQYRILTALEALHLGLPCIRSADPEAAFSNAASIGNSLGGVRKPNSVAAGARTTRPPASAKSTGSAARVPSAISKPASARNATTAAHTTAKLTRSAPKPKESMKSTGQKTKTPKPEPAKEAPKAAVKAEKKDEVEEKDEVFTPEAVPVPSAELSQTPTSELSLEGTPASPNPEVAEDLNGGDNAYLSLVSPAKSPLNEEKPIVDGDQHVPVEEPEVTELPSVTPAEPLNPLVDWGRPQTMPAPVAKNTKPTSAAKTAPGAQSPPEGYYEASASGTRGLIDKMTKHTFVDVAFLPGGGDVCLVDAEFFKRVSARYYIATTAAPTADLLKAMVVGKQASSGDSTEGGNREVSLILARDSPCLLEWAGLNEKRLVDAKIDLLTVEERSTIQVMTVEGAGNGDTSCPGFRLDF
ncbi:unnamed protein product [Hymenolepis diminuta]|uniref:Microtubule-associated protein 1A/B/S-like MBL-like domain-containing protein n=1 Tax=Hymenolepis diminuta TaxID=6216 RepID=A0A564YXB8_HYMDI|nr:unnamed protein product [Hymenolepis diminuta]